MRTRTRRTLLAVTAAVLVLAAVALGACCSPSKDQVAALLLELPKNARFREAGLQRRLVPMRMGGEGVDAELTFVRAGPRAPGATSAAPARPVVLVHGTPSSLFTWTEVVFGEDGTGGLADDFDVVVLDIVGHGVTRTPAPDPMTFQAGADWIVGAIEGLGLGPVHLVGNSYGGEFCWRAALDRPDLVRTLTLIDSSGLPRPADGWLPEEVAMREMSLAPYGWIVATREKVRGALQPHFPEPVTADQVEECFAISKNRENWRAMVDLARDENGTRAAEIPRIACPTLVLWGEDDLAFPVARDAERYAREIPGAELVVLPHCGHYPQETRARDVTERLGAFLRSHP